MSSNPRVELTGDDASEEARASVELMRRLHPGVIKSSPPPPPVSPPAEKPTE